jgi:HK97 family phage prohead protease
MLFKDFDGNYSEDDGGYIVAYASTFDRTPDLHGDIIARGAFTDSLSEWNASGKPIPLIFNHQFDDPSCNIGRVVEAKEDEHGLLVKAEFDAENEKAQYVRKLVQEGRMWKMSFGSIVQDARQAKLDDGSRCREITKSKILEVSIVQIPANEHAEILEVKSGVIAGDGPDCVLDTEPVSKAFTDLALSLGDLNEVLIKALEGMKQTLTLRLTDAEGNVVKEVPLTAEFVTSELESTSDQPDKEPEVNSEETTPTTQEGDLSSTEASDEGETGAPEADEAFLAQMYQTIGQGE